MADPYDPNSTDQNAGQNPAAGDSAASPIVGQPSDDSTPTNPGAASSSSGQLSARNDHLFVIPPHPQTQFDDDYFLQLLEGSISLTLEEKKRVIEAIPRLEQWQIDELIKIFEEEKVKFAELEQNFANDVEKLKQEREKELDLAAQKEEEQQSHDQDVEEAERIKREMGLS